MIRETYALYIQQKAHMKSLVLLLIVVVPFSALAANIDIEPIPDLPLNTIPLASSTEMVPSAGAWKFALGGGVSYTPHYEGAAGYRLRFMPLLEANYNDGHFFMSLLRGMGYNFSEAMRGAIRCAHGTGTQAQRKR